MDEPLETPVAQTYVVLGRFGAMIPLTGGIALWPRIGLGHAWADHEGDHVTAMTIAHLGACFVFMPVTHFGITLGLTADLTLYGSTTVLPAGQEERVEARRTSDGFVLWLGSLGFI